MAETFVTNAAMIKFADALRKKTGENKLFSFPTDFYNAYDSVSLYLSFTIPSNIIDNYIEGKEDIVFTSFSLYKSSVLKSYYAPDKDIYLLNMDTIANAAFAYATFNCLHAPKCRNILSNAFWYAHIKSYDIPNCEYFGSGVFTHCSDIYSWCFNNSVTIDDAFNVCHNLTYIEFLKDASLKSRCFNGCDNLQTVVFRGDHFPNLEDYAFSSCTALTSVYVFAKDFRRSTFIDSTIFKNTPILNGDGSIFVLPDQVEMFKNISALSFIRDKITAFEQE